MKIIQKPLWVALLLACVLAGCDNQTAHKEKEDTQSLDKDFDNFSMPTKALDPTKSNKTGAYLSARIARFHYDFENAFKYASRSFELNDGNLFIQDQALRLAVLEQDFAKAVKFNQTIFKEKTSQVTPFIALFGIVEAIKKNDVNVAKKILKQYGDSLFNTPILGLLGSTIYTIDRDKEKAQSYLDKFKGYEIFNFLKLYHEAMLHIAQKEYDEAFIKLQEAEKYTDPMTARSILAEAWIENKRNNDQAVSNILARAVNRYPDSSIKATELQWKNQHSLNYTGIETYQDVAAEALYHIGIIYAREKDYETALSFFFMADYLSPNKNHIAAVIAETYTAMKLYDKSADFYIRLAKSEGGFVGRDSIINAVYALSNVDRKQEAQEILKDAMVKDPVYYRYHYAMGDLLRIDEKYEQSLEHYNKALELIDKDKIILSWRIHYIRGIVYEHLGNWKKAEKDLLAATRLVPNNPEVVNYLAYSWIDKGKNIEKALLLLDSAVKNAPDNGYIVDSLGWAYYQIKDYAKAEEILLRALQLSPGDPTINEHVGDIYWKVGRKREAVFQWKRALTFNENKKDEKRLKLKIDNGLDYYEKTRGKSSNDKDKLILKEIDQDKSED